MAPSPPLILVFTLLLTVPTTTGALSTSCDSQFEHDPVRTSTGLIIHGHFASNTSSSCVLEYLGIPYAQPPINNLRFSPPRTLLSQPQNLILNATSFGYDCPSTPSKPVTNYPGLTPQAQRIIGYFASGHGAGDGTGQITQSEDCLTLNIWTQPTTRTRTRKSSINNDNTDGNKKKNKNKLKPVIIFFYGGRFTVGFTNTPFYNGKHFAASGAEQDDSVVVVSVNYRLGIFGFPGYGNDMKNEKQNLGLRDQRLAVEWVRDNIEGFGGDPSRIVLMGQSSGGVGVDYWAYYSYKNDGIPVKGIIAHSGNAFSFPGNDRKVQERNWEAVVEAVGCSGIGDIVMACMRKGGWEVLKEAAAGVKPAKSRNVLRSISAFWPVPDGEIVFTAEEYLRLTANGSFSRIPVLIGSTENENGYYQVPAYGQGIVPTEEQVRDFDLESFTCPVLYQAEARKGWGVPSWVYRYFADWENTRLYEGSGAYHGVDLHMVFGGSEDVSGLKMSEEQKGLMRYIQSAWRVFAEDPWNGLEREMGWPKFDAAGKTVVKLGANNKNKVEFGDSAVYHQACQGVVMGALGTAG
ncbi:Alpha/Beta hydrolase protein [Cladorrhinum sp. PSN259]|nr:Alpha/Beta hydrolase protein [Cladorrhinum sp. PSN259]